MNVSAINFRINFSAPYHYEAELIKSYSKNNRLRCFVAKRGFEPLIFWV